MIRFDLPNAVFVEIEIFNIAGQKIETLITRHMKAGHHEVEFNAKNLSSGIYLCRIQADEYHDVKKMMHMK